MTAQSRAELVNALSARCPHTDRASPTDPDVSAGRPIGSHIPDTSIPATSTFVGSSYGEPDEPKQAVVPSRVGGLLVFRARRARVFGSPRACAPVGRTRLAGPAYVRRLVLASGLFVVGADVEPHRAVVLSRKR